MNDTVCILLIETSGQFCSVALSRNEEVIATRESEVKLSHNATLAPFVDEILRETSIDMAALSAVAVSAGPGSYTGLRVGISLAKALCFGADIPLIAVDTLHAMAYGAFRQLGLDATYIANVDARRMEVYAAPFDADGRRLGPTEPAIITANSFQDHLGRGKVVFCGSGTSKCISVLSQSDIACLPMEPKAELLASLAYRSFGEGKFEDPASFKPQYIKPPNITTPRKVTL